MTEADKGQKAEQPSKKYLWLGYGNYGGSSVQLGGGFVRNPGILADFFKHPNKAASPLAWILYAVAGVLAVMGLVMLLAWGITLFIR